MKIKTSVKSVNLTLSLLFCAGLISAFAAFIFIPDSDFSVTEKRVLSAFPDISFSSVADGTFDEKIEEYLQDQTPFRNFFVGLASYAELLTGQNGTSGVYKCSDDYLVNAPAKFDEKNLDNNLKRLNTFADGIDIKKYILPVPQTGYIMSDKLPKNHAEYKDAEIFSRIEQTLAGNYEFVDVTDIFVKNKDSTELYYKTDHHWTMNGAFLAMNEFLKATGKRAVDRTDYDVETHEGFFGTTHSSSAFWLTPPDDMELWRFKNAEILVTIRDIGVETVTTSNDVYFEEHLTEYDMYPVYLNGNHSFTHIVNENADDGVLLILKDSFGNSLASQLVSSYREIIMVDLRYYRTEAVSELIEEYGVDTLLVNYGLDNLINDTNFIWLR